MIDKKQIGNVYSYAIMIAHGCLVFVTGFIFIISFIHPIVLFTWHPILLTIGWFLLLEGLLIFSRENILARQLPHSWRVSIHWLCQSAGAILLFAGFVIVIVNKINNDNPHFHTNHAQYGLAFFILAAFVIAGGILAIFKNTVLFKFLHSVAGFITVIIGMIAFILSFYSGFTVSRSPKFMQYICLILVIYVHIVVLVKPLLTMLNRIRYLVKK